MPRKTTVKEWTPTTATQMQKELEKALTQLKIATSTIPEDLIENNFRLQETAENLKSEIEGLEEDFDAKLEKHKATLANKILVHNTSIAIQLAKDMGCTLVDNARVLSLEELEATHDQIVAEAIASAREETEAKSAIAVNAAVGNVRREKDVEIARLKAQLEGVEDRLTQKDTSIVLLTKELEAARELTAQVSANAARGSVTVNTSDNGK